MIGQIKGKVEREVEKEGENGRGIGHREGRGSRKAEQKEAPGMEKPQVLRGLIDVEGGSV